ncbi:hypothetical protein CR513_55490, partial [Mucuna pruriens]
MSFLDELPRGMSCKDLVQSIFVSSPVKYLSGDYLMGKQFDFGALRHKYLSGKGAIDLGKSAVSAKTDDAERKAAPDSLSPAPENAVETIEGLVMVDEVKGSRGGERKDKAVAVGDSSVGPEHGPLPSLNSIVALVPKTWAHHLVRLSGPSGKQSL